MRSALALLLVAVAAAAHPPQAALRATATDLSAAASLLTSIAPYPALVEVADRVATGSPAAQILQLLATVKNGLDSEQTADISKQTSVRKSCAKEVADTRSAAKAVEDEISSFESQKATMVVDTGVTSKELAQHDEAARRARKMLENVQAQRDEVDGKLAATKRDVHFQDDKHKPHMSRLTHMASVVAKMKDEIANAVKDVAGEGAAPKNGTIEAAAAAAGLPASKVVKALAEDAAAEQHVKGNAVLAAADNKAKAALLEVADARAGAGVSAQQSMDMGAGLALRKLALGLESGGDGDSAADKAGDWVGLVQGKLETLQGSFQGQIVRAMTVYNASQAANEARVTAFTADLARLDAKLSKLNGFLKSTAQTGVHNAKAKIERLGAQLADTKTQLDRSAQRLTDAKAANTEAEETCKTYEAEFKERRKAATQEMSLLTQLEAMITAKLASIKAILAKAQGALVKKNAMNQ